MKLKEYRLVLDKESRLPVMEEVAQYGDKVKLGTYDSVAELLIGTLHLGDRAEEYVYCIPVNTKNETISVFELSHGSTNLSIAGIPEIFRRVLLSGASRFILAHNHPSGDPQPSKEDIALTTKIRKACATMSMSLLDHLVIGGTEYYSMHEHGNL